jgi:hypothetical protein
MSTYFDANGVSVFLFYQYQVQWRGVVSPKERSNNPAIICVNFHELNFNSLPLQMGERPRCITYSKSHPKRGGRTPLNPIKLGLKMQTKCSLKKQKINGQIWQWLFTGF